MFNLDTILKTLNSYNISSHKYGPTIYQNNNKIGICIDIKDSVFGYLSRAFTFNDNNSLEAFLKKYTWYKNNHQEFNINLGLDTYTIPEPNIKYTYNNKELSLEEMLNFKNVMNEKEEKLINDENKNIYLINIRELTHYLIDLKRKKEQTKTEKNSLKMTENDLKYELLQSLAIYYGQNKNFEKKAVSLENLLPNNDIALLETNLANINTKSLEEIKSYLSSLVNITKEEELDEKNLINVYSNSIYKYNIEILKKQIAFVKSKIETEKKFNAKGSKIHNIDAELKSFLNTSIAPTKIDVFISENKKIINNKYNSLTDIKDAYSIISGNKLATTTSNNNLTANKSNPINDLITKFENLDKQTKAHLVLYNSFYKRICNYIIDNNYPSIEDIKNNFDFDYYYKYFEEIIYNENNSHYLINYFNYLNFKSLDGFITSLIDVSKTVTRVVFTPLSDIKVFGTNESSSYKDLTTTPLYNRKENIYIVTITPINQILFIPEKLELNEDTKELSKTNINNIYIKANITDTNNTITINKYNKVEEKYNNSEIIITTNLILYSETTFHIGRIEGV